MHVKRPLGGLLQVLIRIAGARRTIDTRSESSWLAVYLARAIPKHRVKHSTLDADQENWTAMPWTPYKNAYLRPKISAITYDAMLQSCALPLTILIST